jgi:hypothetical protein
VVAAHDLVGGEAQPTLPEHRPQIPEPAHG